MSRLARIALALLLATVQLPGSICARQCTSDHFSGACAILVG